jgi:GNAT superfamily N-acetyltransferase
MNPIPLSEKYLAETIALAHKVFPLDAASGNPPEKGFRKSLGSELNDESWKTATKGKKLKRLNYWILLDEEKSKVVGVTGIYSFTDPEDEAWMAWYCLDPIMRGKGLGRKLLEWTMDKAREDGYKKFKLYTSTDPNESIAQKLYDDVGLNITAEEDDPNSPYKIMYRERDL